MTRPTKLVVLRHASCAASTNGFTLISMGLVPSFAAPSKMPRANSAVSDPLAPAIVSVAEADGKPASRFSRPQLRVRRSRRSRNVQDLDATPGALLRRHEHVQWMRQD